MADIKQRTAPMPELLERNDLEMNEGQGGWSIDHCEAMRGKPHTIIRERRMVVPLLDTEYSRLIRAHEMMHARVSPEDFTPFFEREIASERGLRAAEELRVNYLLKRTDFDTSALTDNSELRSGENVAHANDWSEAVYFLAAVVSTGGLNGYITGVRRTQPEWANTLRAIARRLEKLAKDSYEKGELQDTTQWGELGPKGMRFTESCGELLDRLAKPPAPPEPEPAPEPVQKDDAQKDDGGKKKAKPKGRPAPLKPENVKKMKPHKPRLRGNPDGAPGKWRELVISRPTLTEPAPGGLGIQRTISNRGKNPRYLHRALTDPKRRIFEKATRGNGGVVVFDMSASMGLSVEEIQSILTAAPGATVVGYKHVKSSKTKENFWVLADRGRMINKDNLPTARGTNSSDLPALKWAVKAKQHPHAPVVWITDGQVHDGTSDWHMTQARMARECVDFVSANRIMVATDPKSAVKLLEELAVNRRPKWDWPQGMKQLYSRQMGGAQLPSPSGQPLDDLIPCRSQAKGTT
jgi:hypothetical protein